MIQARREVAEPVRPVTRRAPWVLVSAGFHEYGGQSKANAALAEYLLHRGHEVHLVGHEIAPRFLNHDRVRAHVVSCPAGRDLLGWVTLDRAGRGVAREVTGRDPAARVVVNGGCSNWPDVNWVHCVHSAWGFADHGAPVWFRIKNRLTKWWARRKERRAIREARLVVTNSEQTRQHVLNHLDLPPGRVHAVPLGADAVTPPTADERAEARRRLGIPDDRPAVFFVGALGHDHNKGFDTLLAAWKALAAGGWDGLLLVAGDGNGVGRWKARVGSDGLGGQVQFLGFTRRLAEWLIAADLLVSPVRYEAFGLNVQEAVCLGVPALVSRRAGVVERYPSELEGMTLPDPEDWRQLAERLRLWRADVEGWRQRFRPLGEWLRAYGWPQMAERLVGLVESRGES